MSFEVCNDTAVSFKFDERKEVMAMSVEDFSNFECNVDFSNIGSIPIDPDPVFDPGYSGVVNSTFQRTLDNSGGIIRSDGLVNCDFVTMLRTKDSYTFDQEIIKKGAAKFFEDSMRAEEEMLISLKGRICSVINRSVSGIGINSIQVTNLLNPRVDRFKKLSDETCPLCYRLAGEVLGEKIEVFLNSSKLETKGYIIKKFNEHNISNSIKGSAKAAHLYGELIKRLSSEGGVVEVPDECGWYKNGAGIIKICLKGELTWTKIEKLMK